MSEYFGLNKPEMSVYIQYLISIHHVHRKHVSFAAVSLKAGHDSYSYCEKEKVSSYISTIESADMTRNLVL